MGGDSTRGEALVGGETVWFGMAGTVSVVVDGAVAVTDLEGTEQVVVIKERNIHCSARYEIITSIVQRDAKANTNPEAGVSCAEGSLE